MVTIDGKVVKAADLCRSLFPLVYIPQILLPLLKPPFPIPHLLLHNTSGNMVHLGQVTNDSEVQKGNAGGIDESQLGPQGAQSGDFETSIYGSRFAAEDLPRHEMPSGEMPAATAYRMIKDDLTLDGNPTLKCVVYQATSATATAY